MIKSCKFITSLLLALLITALLVTAVLAATKLNAPLVSGGNVEDDFQINPDSVWVVYRADQDTDEVKELYSVPIGGDIYSLYLPLIIKN